MLDLFDRATWTERQWRKKGCAENIEINLSFTANTKPRPAWDLGMTERFYANRARFRHKVLTTQQADKVRFRRDINTMMRWYRWPR